MMSFIRFSTLLLLLISWVQEKSYANDICWDSIPIAGEVSIGYDDFRGISDGSWNGNTGGLSGVNFGISLLDMFGIQAGGSYGIYDWYGRGPVAEKNRGEIQQQGFLTSGLFYKTSCPNGFQGAFVVDWMFNKNFGVFGLNPSLGQLRLQAGYLFNHSNEFGFWGTLDVRTAHKTSFHVPVSYRAISQANLFWRYYFENFAETMVWVGVPYKKSLMFSKKRAGSYIVGTSIRVPITSRLNIDAHAVYMGPNHFSSSNRFRNYSTNICIGFSYTFGSSGNCYEQKQANPYLPIANNSTFLVDASLTD